MFALDLTAKGDSARDATWRLFALAVNLVELLVLFASAPEVVPEVAAAELPPLVRLPPEALPEEPPAAVPGGLPTADPGDVPAAIAGEAPAAVPLEVPAALAPEVPPALPPEVPPALPPEVPPALPPEAPPALPPEVPAALPGELVLGTALLLPAELPADGVALVKVVPLPLLLTEEVELLGLGTVMLLLACTAEGLSGRAV